MDVGVAVFAGSYGLAPPALGRAVEERGFESLFYAEHTHIPVASRRPDGRPVRPFAETYDPFVALAAVAAVTTTLKVGTGGCRITERDPIITAKAVASLDRLAEGRFLFGVGAGWNREELANHGTDPHTRMGLLSARVHAMRRIWTEDEAEYHGNFVNFDPIWSWPKPAQRPHPPVLLGGESGYTLQRVVDLCDGWFPRARNHEAVMSALKDLRARAAKAGRDMKTISISVFGAPPDEAKLDAYREAGFTRALLRLPPEGRDVVLPLIDQWAKLIH